MDVEELLNEVMVDDFYFKATGGGITFGGGEPLLRSTEIVHFCQLMPAEWNITIDTSLHVDSRHLESVAPYVHQYIIDVKDMNPEIYRSYTGGEAFLAWNNLEWLLQTAGAERVMVRVPLIPGFNSESDRQRSVELLQAMGVRQLDCFTYRVKE